MSSQVKTKAAAAGATRATCTRRATGDQQLRRARLCLRAKPPNWDATCLCGKGANQSVGARAILPIAPIGNTGAPTLAHSIISRKRKQPLAPLKLAAKLIGSLSLSVCVTFTWRRRQTNTWGAGEKSYKTTSHAARVFAATLIRLNTNKLVRGTTFAN